MEDEEDIQRIMRELRIQSKQKEAAGSLYYYLIKHRIEPETIIDQLRDLLFSSDRVDQIGGFLAVNKILEVGRETKVLHFVIAIMPATFKYLYQYDIPIMFRAVEWLGNLAQSGGNFTAENVESHIDTCFEWIRSKPPKVGIFGGSESKLYNKKFAAILVLSQFTEKMPIIAYNKLVSTNNYLKLFECLKDSKLEVRQATVQFFKAINKLIIQRDPNERKVFYEAIYGKAKDEIQGADQNSVHGSLLIISFLLTETEDSLKEKHDELFPLIYALSEKK